MEGEVVKIMYPFQARKSAYIFAVIYKTNAPQTGQLSFDI